MKSTTEKSLGVRRYTAQEMRVRADYLEVALADAKTAAMLRQAADMMEREEKREKKYEYGILPCGTNGVYQTRVAAELQQLILEQSGYKYPIVRRKVGEWEEVE